MPIAPLRGVVVALLGALATTALPAHAGAPLTLTQALELASSQSPAMAAARLRVDEARAPLLDARSLLSANPDLTISTAPWRDSATGSPLELELEQRFMLPGVRGARLQVGREALSAAEATAEDFERAWLLTVARDFLDALATSERVEILAEDEQLTRTLLDIARLRVEKGADAPLSLSAARIRLAESQRRLLQGQTAQRTAAMQLAARLGLSPLDPPVPTGALPTQAGPVDEADALVEHALAARPDLAALSHELETARAELRVARRAAWPELALGARYEDLDADPLTLATVGVQVPLFDRNQGERASSKARAERLEQRQRAALLDLEAEVRGAWDHRASAARAVDLYDQDVVAAMDDSLAMLTRMFEAGKVDYAQVVSLQRERLDASLGFIAARLDLARADADLQASVGLPLHTSDLGQRR